MSAPVPETNAESEDEVIEVTMRPRKRYIFTAQQKKIDEVRIVVKMDLKRQDFRWIGNWMLALFLGLLGALALPEFSGFKIDYPLFFYGSMAIIGYGVQQFAYWSHEKKYGEYDKREWDAVEEKVRGINQDFKNMKKDKLAENMRAVGLGGGQWED